MRTQARIQEKYNPGMQLDHRFFFTKRVGGIRNTNSAPKIIQNEGKQYQRNPNAYLDLISNTSLNTIHQVD